jgi:hypothetical protein
MSEDPEVATIASGLTATTVGFAPMPTTAYRIVLDSFHIDNTRAPDEDTDVIAFQGTLDGNDLPKLSLSTGDVDNGDHLINLQFDPIDVRATSQFAAKFTIVNSGNANDAAFVKKVQDALDSAKTAVVPFAGGASIWIEVGVEVVKFLTGLLPDCDGPVAGDVMHASGQELAQLTINWPHIFRTTRGYPGQDSHVLCGSNSEYSVSWYVQRLNPAEPRLDLLVHLQGYGDRTWHENQFAGTRHEGRRIEGFSLQIDPPVEGLSLRYMAHLESTGDTRWFDEGEFVGTRGQSRRLEGFAIELQGPAASKYYVEYQVQVQGQGETGPKLNGAFCGTRGQALRLEGMQVVIRPMPTGPGPS